MLSIGAGSIVAFLTKKIITDPQINSYRFGLAVAGGIVGRFLMNIARAVKFNDYLEDDINYALIDENYSMKKNKSDTNSIKEE